MRTLLQLATLFTFFIAIYTSTKLRTEAVSSSEQYDGPFFDPNKRYWIKNYKSGKALTINGGFMRDYQPVDQWEYLGYANQIWKLDRQMQYTWNGPSYLIRNYANPQFVLQNIPSSGQQLFIKTADVSVRQLFGFARQPEANLYGIQDVDSVTCLNVEGASMDSGARVISWFPVRTRDGIKFADNEKWYLVEV